MTLPGGRNLAGIAPGDTILVDARPLFLGPSKFVEATFVRWLGVTGKYIPGCFNTALVLTDTKAPALEPCDEGAKVLSPFIRTKDKDHD